MSDQQSPGPGTTNYLGDIVPIPVAIDRLNAADAARAAELNQNHFQGDTTSGSGSTSEGNGSLLWPLFVVAVAIWVVFHYGLLHAMFTSVLGVFEMAAVVLVSKFLISPKGVGAVRMIVGLIVIGAVLFALLMFVGYKIGIVKQIPPPPYATNAAQPQHHKHVESNYRTAAHEPDSER